MPPWARGSLDDEESDEEPDEELLDDADTCDVASSPSDDDEAPASSASSNDDENPPPKPPKKNPGRQPGAKGHGRTQKLPIDRVEEHRPTICKGCGEALGDDADSIRNWRVL